MIRRPRNTSTPNYRDSRVSREAESATEHPREGWFDGKVVYRYFGPAPSRAPTAHCSSLFAITVWRCEADDRGRANRRRRAYGDSACGHSIRYDTIREVGLLAMMGDSQCRLKRIDRGAPRGSGSTHYEVGEEGPMDEMGWGACETDSKAESDRDERWMGRGNARRRMGT